LEGATTDAATVIAPDALLVYGHSREREISFFIDEINTVLASVLVFFFGVVCNSWRVVVDVGGITASAPYTRKKGV
jgi:hypothetical protein